MFSIILTLSADFLATVRAIATELPQVYIDTARVQTLTLKASVSEAEARHMAASYVASGHYDRVEVVRQ